MIFVFFRLIYHVFRWFFYIYLYYIFSVSLPLFFLFFACDSTFEQGHLEPWRYINAFIIITSILPVLRTG